MGGVAAPPANAGGAAGAGGGAGAGRAGGQGAPAAKPQRAGFVRARVHDRKSPLLAGELREVVAEWTTSSGPVRVPMQWYGEFLWRAAVPAGVPAGAAMRIIVTDAAGNATSAAINRRSGSPVP
jgi:hypothetical protein